MHSRVGGTVKSLFRLLPANCDVSYLNLYQATKGGSKAAREQCEELWLRIHDLADNQFIERFPFEFEQRWF